MGLVHAMTSGTECKAKGSQHDSLVGLDSAVVAGTRVCCGSQERGGARPHIDCVVCLTPLRLAVSYNDMSVSIPVDQVWNYVNQLVAHGVWKVEARPDAKFCGPCTLCFHPRLNSGHCECRPDGAAHAVVGIRPMPCCRPAPRTQQPMWVVRRRVACERVRDVTTRDAARAAAGRCERKGSADARER